MSLRDRLREQAEEVKQRRSTEQGAAEDKQRFYESALRPRLLHAAEYFEAVVADLNVVQPSVRATFPIGPLNDPEVPFLYGAYQFAVDDAANPRELSVTVDATLSVPVTRQVYDLRDADVFEQRLRDMGIGYYRRREQDLRHRHSESSRFTAEGAISCGFRIRVDVEARQFLVETRNLEDPPRRAHPLAAERLDEELLDTLGRLLIREVPQLISCELDDAARERLQRDVQARRRQHAMEMARAQAEAGHEPGQLQRSIASVRESASRVADSVAAKAADAVDRYRRRGDDDG